MNTKHTPGPWQVVNDNALPEIREANSPFRVIADFEWTEDSASMRANARLIAAAPDLLEALATAHALLAKIYDESGRGTTVWHEFPRVNSDALAAIAKATDCGHNLQSLHDAWSDATKATGDEA